MALTIYGVPKSRAIRTLWMAKELDIPYTLDEVGFGPEGCRSPAFLAINPNGHIPAMDDDGVVLVESLAMNLYLARKHGGPLAPANIGEEGQMLSWSFWSALEVEPHAAQAMYHTAFYPPAERKPEVAAEALEKVKAPLAVLEAHLAKHGFLVGGRFTVADLNLLTCLFYLRFTPQALADMPATTAYYEAGFARPACKAAFALRGD
eukprot:gene9684-9748_t